METARPGRGAGGNGAKVERTATLNSNANTAPAQGRVERDIYDGRRFLGVVRETADGTFVAIVGEHVVGRFDTTADATDRLLELARPGAAP